MKSENSDLRLLSNWFDRMHMVISNLRLGVCRMDDPESQAMAFELEQAVLIRLLRLRRRLKIPYDWHERRGYRGQTNLQEGGLDK